MASPDDLSDRPQENVESLAPNQMTHSQDDRCARDPVLLADTPGTRRRVESGNIHTVRDHGRSGSVWELCRHGLCEGAAVRRNGGHTGKSAPEGFTIEAVETSPISNLLMDEYVNPPEGRDYGEVCDERAAGSFREGEVGVYERGVTVLDEPPDVSAMFTRSSNPPSLCSRLRKRHPAIQERAEPHAQQPPHWSFKRRQSDHFHPVDCLLRAGMEDRQSIHMPCQRRRFV